MSDEYKRNSLDAVLSRLETKLDSALARQGVQEREIKKLWGALGKLDGRVAAIAATISAIAATIAWVIKH